MSIPRSFSPSQTQDYSFCPRYWGLRKANYKPRGIEYPEIAAMVGTSVAAGLEVFYKARRINQPVEPSVCTTVALDVAKVEMTAALANGARYVTIKERDRWERIPESVESVLTTHRRVDPFRGYTVESVEESGAFHDRTDLILRDERGILVVDFKTKLNLVAEWVKKEQSVWARSWQLHHYAITRGADRFAAALICPRTRQGVYYEIIQVDPRYKQLWLRDAVRLWAEMEVHEHSSLEQLRGNTSHSNEYGECTYWSEACSVGLDSAHMTANLVQIERPKRVALKEEPHEPD